MAVKDCILIIDIFTLKQKIKDEFLKIFFEVFFDPGLKRIGFDIKSDLDYLRQTFSWMPEYIQLHQPEFYCMQAFIKIVCLFHFTVYLEIYYIIQVTKNVEWHECFPVLETPSLERVVEKWLKKTICKDERTGNWEARPLTESQMQYAALDARYTLEAYQYVQEEL